MIASRGVQGARAPMFPGPEPAPQWDDFGAVTDLAATFGQVRLFPPKK